MKASVLPTEESLSFLSLTAECLACPVRQLAVYAPLPADDVQELAAIRRGRRNFPARSIIMRQGDRPSLFYTLTSGWACRFKLMSDGRRQILSILLPGDPIGPDFPQTEVMAFGIEAVTDVTLCALDAAGFAALLGKRSDLALGALKAALVRADTADDLVVTLGRRNSLQRVAHLILHLEARLRRCGIATDHPFEFPLRQKHIADATGLTSVHVSRIMGELENSGAIKLSARTLEITDRAGLEAVVRNSSARD
jgi:CRP-like cAMP-binding protein